MLSWSLIYNSMICNFLIQLIYNDLKAIIDWIHRLDNQQQEIINSRKKIA